MRKILRTAGYFWGHVVLIASCSGTLVADDRPNIVLIIADDMNWDDRRSDSIPTHRTPDEFDRETAAPLPARIRPRPSKREMEAKRSAEQSALQSIKTRAPGAAIVGRALLPVPSQTEKSARPTLLAANGRAATETAARPDTAVRVTHGPMLGRFGAHSVLVWARTSRPGRFHVAFGLTPDRLEGVSDSVATELARDNTGVVKVHDLAADTRYHYCVVTQDGHKSPGGTFKTLPDPVKRRDPKLNPRGLFNFSFEFACGNNQNPTHGLGPGLPTYDTLLAKVSRDVDFAILNGDWLYEEARDYPLGQWHKQVGITSAQTPHVVSIAPTIVGVWENYKVYLDRAKNLAEWHRHVPSYFTFDDHEIVNDVFGTGTAGYRNRRTVFRDIAVQAWFDYLGWSNPVRHDQPIHFGRGLVTAASDVLTDRDADFSRLDLRQAGNLHIHWGTDDAGVKDIPTGDVDGGDPNAGVYNVVEVLDKHRLKIQPAVRATGTVSYSVGRRSYGAFSVGNCAFYLLDTRSHRDLHDLKHPDKPGLSLLGTQQTRWLMEEMGISDADFHFVVSSVNFMIPHVGGGGHAFDAQLKDDAWTAFLHEREQLIKFWDSLKTPVFVLTGDLHNSFVVKITDTVWEFASGPHNSVNHRPEDEGNRPMNGRFQHGPRPCQIRWSTTAMPDIPRENRMFPHYCVVQVNNVFNNPVERSGQRWIAFPHPHVIFQYYDGLTGKLQYAETISTPMEETQQ